MNPTERASADVVELRLADDRLPLHIRPSKLIVAGYTGRDEAAVQEHIDELAAIGIAPPAQVPMFFDLYPVLLSTAPVIEVDGSNTSGEVEPLVIRHENRWYLGVGSDHTDRDLEREDISKSKAACPKPMGSDIVPLPDDLLDGGWDSFWDSTEASCEVDGVTHQMGDLAALRPPSDLLPRIVDAVDQDADLVVFCGTVPAVGGEFRTGGTWTLTLSLASGRALTHTYQLKERSL